MKESSSDVRPNHVTYGILINIHCKAGQIEQALDVYREMLSDRDTVPDQHIYSSLFEGMARCGNNKYAEGLLEDMDTLNARPNIVVYNALMMTYMRAASPDLHGCREVMRRIVSDPNIRPDVRTYNTLFSAYASVSSPIPGYAKQIWKWYTEMRSKYRLRRDGFTFNLGVRALHKAQDWRYAWAVYEDALIAANRDPRILRDCFGSPEMIVSLMELCLNQHQSSQVMQLWHDSNRLGLRPIPQMAVMMLHACARQGAVNTAKANIEAFMDPEPINEDMSLEQQQRQGFPLPPGSSSSSSSSSLPKDPIDRMDLTKPHTPSTDSGATIQPISYQRAANVLTPQLMLVYLTLLIKFGCARDVLPTLRRWVQYIPQAQVTESMVNSLVNTIRDVTTTPTQESDSSLIISELLTFVEEYFPAAVPV